MIIILVALTACTTYPKSGPYNSNADEDISCLNHVDGRHGYCDKNGVK